MDPDPDPDFWIRTQEKSDPGPGKGPGSETLVIQISLLSPSYQDQFTLHIVLQISLLFI